MDLKEFKCDLVFSRTTSLFKSQEFIDSKQIKKDIQLGNGNEDADITFNAGVPISKYLCVKTSLIDSTIISKVFEYFEGSMKEYIIDESISKIEWIITNETKNIGAIKCQKASCRFRGRNYIVWYTEEIPLPFGPWKLGGLPGLILEAADDENGVQFLAEEINISPQMRTLTFPNSQGKAITLEGYARLKKRAVNEFEDFLKSKLPRNSTVSISVGKDTNIEREFE